MLLNYQEYRLFQSLPFRNVLLKVQRRFCADSKSEKLDPKLLSRRPSHASGCPSVSTIQACIRLDISATRSDALQSFRRIQRSSASVRTMWQHRLDASQYLTSKRISFPDTDMGRQLQPSEHQVYTIRTLSLIRQDVEKNCNRSDVRVTLSERQSLLWKLYVAEVKPSGR